MSTALLIYLYIVIGKVIAIMGVVSVVFGIFLAVLAITGTVTYIAKHLEGDSNDWVYKTKPFVRPIAWFYIIVIFLHSLYPSKEDLAIIIGGSALVSVAQTEEAKKLPDNILNAANRFLEGVGE